MAKDAPPSFQFYPRDFLSSTAVALMSPEARGGYITLLCHAWMQQEPGILDDEDCSLAALSGLGERWAACAQAIRRAFKSTSREGRKVLTQERMVAERQAQERRFESASKGARITNAFRWGSSARRSNSESQSDRSSVSLASASALEAKSKEEPTPDRPPADAGRVVGLPVRKKTRRKAGEPDGFGDWYDAYPRREDRDSAAAAYRSALANGASADQLLAAAVAWGRQWRGVEQRPTDKIKLPASFLNAGTWKDLPVDETPAEETSEQRRERARKEFEAW